MAKLRWRIERDYQVLKDQLGLDHFEGRTWRGFHHHASLCIAAYGFLLAEETRLFPPTSQEILQRIQFDFSRNHPWTPAPRPRGAPCGGLPGDPSDPDRAGPDGDDGSLSLLRKVWAAAGQGRVVQAPTGAVPMRLSPLRGKARSGLSKSNKPGMNGEERG